MFLLRLSTVFKALLLTLSVSSGSLSFRSSSPIARSVPNQVQVAACLIALIRDTHSLLKDSFLSRDTTVGSTSQKSSFRPSPTPPKPRGRVPLFDQSRFTPPPSILSYDVRARTISSSPSGLVHRFPVVEPVRTGARSGFTPPLHSSCKGSLSESGAYMHLFHDPRDAPQLADDGDF
jgi:hypothetical protein